MYKKIVFIGDLLRYQNNNTQFADRGLLWEYYLFKEQIRQIVDLPIEVVTSKNTDKFDICKFYELCGYKLDTENWIRIASKEYTKEAKNYFKSCFEDCIIVTQVAGAMKFLFDELNIPYIDIYVSAIKFCSDLFFAFRSNIPQITEKLKTYEIDEERFYIEAAQLKSYYCARNINLNIEPNSLLLCGQTNIDLSLVKDNKLVKFLDYKEKLESLFKEYSNIYYKPHPYATLDNPNEQFIRGFKNLRIINENIYKILCDDNIKAVAALSSGTLLEAKYFHKKSHTISHNFVNYFNDNKENQPEDFIVIDRECFASQFWSDILSVLIPTKKGKGLLLNYPPNYLRDSLNTWWGYEIGCSRDYVNQQLYYINEHFSNVENELRKSLKPKKILQKLLSLLILNKKLRKKMAGEK